MVEVGPGPGAITRALLDAGARHVIAVEKDRRFIPSLEVCTWWYWLGGVWYLLMLVGLFNQAILQVEMDGVGISIIFLHFFLTESLQIIFSVPPVTSFFRPGKRLGTFFVPGEPLAMWVLCSMSNDSTGAYKWSQSPPWRRVPV